MRRKLFSALAIMLALSISVFAFACSGSGTSGDGNQPTDYGALSIESITLEEGNTVAISPVFTKEEYAITYAFDSDAITIANGLVTAVKAGTVTVTATTAHHEVTFTVTVTQKLIDYGTLSIQSVTLEEGKTATIQPVFTKDEYEIEYAFDSDAITITDGVITAVRGGETVTVTATTAYHEVTFTVTTTEIDYGTLTVANVSQVKEGERARLFVSFSKSEHKSEITYEFDSDAITIEDGYVTAVRGGETITVTAKTAHHETTFTVVTIVNVGELTIDDVFAWVGYPASYFFPKFTKPECAEELSYQYDATGIEVDADNGTIIAYEPGEYKVIATSESFRATFTVKAEIVDKNAKKPNGNKKYDTDFAGAATSRLATWNNEGKNGVSTIFIGDSFFDGAFWGNFYTHDHYAGKEAVRLGVSATTSYDWEQWSTGWLAETDPRNIVMHMGTNNVYDDGDNATTATSALQRMFTVMHTSLPDAKIYWFSISQRSYDVDKQAIVSIVNNNMKKWCENFDWITYIHTVDTLTPDKLKDNIHPKPEAYSVFRDALAKTDIVIVDKPTEQGVNMVSVGHEESTVSFDKATGKLTATSPASNKRAAAYLKNDGEFYRGSFVVSGTITTASTAGWIALFMNSSPADFWFNAAEELPAAAIVFPTGKAELWGYKSGGGNSSIASGVTYSSFTYSVAYHDGVAIWQINSSYKEVALSAGSVPFFGFVNESNTITATVVADFDEDNVVDAIAKIKAGQEVPDYGAKINDISVNSSQSINNGSGLFNVYYKSGMLNRNFIFEGKLDITNSGKNAHIQFGVDTGSNRVLLWDNATQKTFKLCIPYITDGIPAEDIYTRVDGQTLTISWKIVMTDDDLYFFIDDQLKLVFSNLPLGELKIGSEAADCKFYDMKALTLADDGENYTTELAKYNSIISQYANNTGKIRV